MNVPNQSSLDQEELLHLAIVDSMNKQHDAAIEKLKRCIDQGQQTDGRALYLLAAEHAEIGLYERAITEFERAIALGNIPATAHLQLGFLLFILGRKNEAEQALEKLETGNSPANLLAFKHGLIALANEQIAPALEAIERGLAQTNDNPSLASNMRRLADSVRAQLSQPDDTEPTDQQDRSHLLISTYSTSDSESH